MSPRKRMRRVGLAVAGPLIATVLAMAALAGRVDAQQQFPHARHHGLFPLCTGCHEGIATGDSATMFPKPELCAQCHTGRTLPKVSWDGPKLPVTNVHFSHQVHIRMLREAGDSALTCEQCHSAPGSRMAVGAMPHMSTCFSCHAHRATSHFVDAKCSTCHVPLARSGFALGQIRDLPVPSDHRDSTFLIDGHGEAAAAGTSRCATCHTRQKCLSCHVDGSRKEIQAIPMAPAGMQLPVAKAHYPVPASHKGGNWLSKHSEQAGGGRCNTCHTRNDCLACHVGTIPKQVLALTPRKQSRAPGVGLERHAPPSHASHFFMKVHPTLASSDDRSCQTCHTESFCTDCHDGPANGGYHPPDYVMRHPADAFARESDCSACHNTAVFCRDCHVESGLSTTGRLGASYHTAEPLWLLRHGQAARQNLEACASCHKQRDCLQCHSTLGAFKINPHGPDFDAARAWAKNPRICLACHVTNPLDNGSQP